MVSYCYMLPAKYNLTVPVHSTIQYDFKWVDSATSLPIDLTGKVIESHILIGEKTVLFDPLVVLGAGVGEFALLFTASQTQQFVPYAIKQARYIIRIDDIRIIEGNVVFNHE